MRIGSFIERNIVAIGLGTLGAFSSLLGYKLYKYDQLNEYGPKTVETSTQVCNKNPFVHSRVQNQIREQELDAKETYEKWKSVNDSLDWEQAKALRNRVTDITLKEKVEKELSKATPQQAVNRWKQVADSIEKSASKLSIRW